jgi:hypothetical protein
MFNGFNQFRTSKTEKVKQPSLLDKGRERLKQLFQKKRPVEATQRQFEPSLLTQEMVQNTPKNRPESEMKEARTILNGVRLKLMELINHTYPTTSDPEFSELSTKNKEIIDQKGLKLDALLEENLLKYKQSGLTIESLIEEQIHYFNDRYNKTDYLKEPFKKSIYDKIVIGLENNLKNHRNEGVIDLDELPERVDVNNGLEPIDVDDLNIFSTRS